MYRTLAIRASWLLLCLLTFARTSVSQTPSSATPSPSPQQIVYTGSLFGYFRVPDLQSGTAVRCPASPSPKESSTSSRKDNEDKYPNSKAADRFLEKQRAEFANAILVGTGDNFAPRLEARIFDPPPPNSNRDVYAPRNKELYTWDGKNWLLDIPTDKAGKELRGRVEEGEGTIPNDNVGCFLAAAGYAAVVPGKHDFYFGPERVRELARFMAGIPKPKDDTKPPDYRAVQMLGANLLIKTTRIEDAPPAPNKNKPKWPDAFAPMNLQSSVYPWFSYVHVKLMELPEGKLLNALKQRLAERKERTDESAFRSVLDVVRAGGDGEDVKVLEEKIKAFRGYDLLLCPSQGDGKIPQQIKECRPSPVEWRVSISGNNVVYEVALDPDERDKPYEEARFSTLHAGESYGLCLNKKGSPTIKEETCLPFSANTPFFYSPHNLPEAGVDPDPYVFLEKDNVAIFGVVDPNILQQVGILNYSWFNRDNKLKTEVSAEDPANAVRQQLDYFERRHPGFTGLKILLAQMSPSLARVLAARLPQFQVVVTEADQEQATSETVLSTEWSPNGRAGVFVAVPSPYFDLEQDKSREGTLHLGSIETSKVKGKNSWWLTARILSPTPIERRAERSTYSSTASSQTFQERIASNLDRCLSAPPANPDEPFDRIKWLTLCAMREQTGADVALLQKRDFFDELPPEALNEPEQFQRALDRIIWKGDLVTLLYVPGSALKKALAQSKKYDDDDKNLLSLADEKFHGLVYLGIKKEDKDYLVNEIPLDEKKIYVVATSDYIGAGDTGYPDLAAAALNPKIRPGQFPKEFDTISSLVCRRLFPEKPDAAKFCLHQLMRDDSLDRSTAKAAPPNKQPTLGKRLWKLEPFKWPPASGEPAGTDNALEQKAQHHPIWTLALRNLSLGFSSLSNNLTDAQIAQKFAGVPTSGVTASKTHTVTVGLDTRLSRTSHRNEFFVAMGIDYKEQSTGDTTPRIFQINNRLTGDAGFIDNTRGGRSQARVGITFTLHAEAPLQHPFTTFTLGTQDRIKIIQNRGVLLLPRIGLRWQNRSNSFEAGAQAGREIHALSGYRFITQGSIIECLPNATETFAACISRLSKPPITAITKDSTATAILKDRPRAGFYWKFGLSIPLGTKVKYQLTQDADFFFNFHQDNATDTRYRDNSKHSLKFFIWPNFSIGPSLQLLLYQNKVKRDFLFQKQFGFEASFAFDLFNRREKRVQLEHKP
jgi:hypothetical protein